MKKTVLAVVLSVSALSAMAQNVEVYGTIDASVAEVKTAGVKNTAQGNGDYLGSSILGFRGSENIGGGIKASFDLQGDLNVNNGQGDGSGGGLTFDRQSWVELSLGSNSIRMGRLQDIAKDSYSYAIAGMNLADTSGMTGFSTTLGQGNRYPNYTRVETKLAGFRVSAAYSNDTAATKTGTGQGDESTVFGVEGTVAKDIKVIVTTATKGQAKGNTFGARFAVGAAEIGTLYARQDSGTGVTASMYQVGAVYPVTAGLNLRASYAKNDSDRDTADADLYAVMLEKAFSKRTSVYVGYSDLDVNNGVTGDTKIATVGLQHKF